MGSYKWGYGVPLRFPLKGSIGFFRVEGLGVVISGVISPLIWVISVVILLITLLIATHEPLQLEAMECFSFVIGIRFEDVG